MTPYIVRLCTYILQHRPGGLHNDIWMTGDYKLANGRPVNLEARSTLRSGFFFTLAQLGICLPHHKAGCFLAKSHVRVKC